MQLIARGILLPEDPSCDSVSASDLDFSNLSLDSGMDRLSRLADSLVEGLTPVSQAGFAQDAKAGFSIQSLVATDDEMGSSVSGMAQRLTADSIADSRVSQDGKSAAEVRQAGSRHQPKASHTQSHVARGAAHVTAEASHASSESASEADWLQTSAGSQTDSHLQGNTGESLGHSSPDSSHMPHHQPHMHQMPHGAAAASVQASKAARHADASTDSLCRHSLPVAQRSGTGSAPQGTHMSRHTSSQPTPSHSAATRQSSLKDQHAAPQSTATGQSASEASSDAAHASASEAASPQSAAESSPAHQQSVDHQTSFEDQSHSGADSPVGGHAAAPQREQQEGLMSDSESEFEQSLVTARMLRPMNASQQAARYI